MEIIPAIDIHLGKCVRLVQGQLEQETIYSTDPVFMAKMWQAKGAKRLHIVDLDGAFCGTPRNWELIEQIRKAFSGVIEFGGGLRDLKSIEKIIEIGIDRIILGTLLIYNPELVRKIVSTYNSKVIAAIDIYEGKIAIGGWKEKTSTEPKEFMEKIEQMGISEVIVTDVSKDGTLSGPDIPQIKKFLESTSSNVIISGGISSVEDVKKIKELEGCGVVGIIIGKALYSEPVKFEELMNL